MPQFFGIAPGEEKKAPGLRVRITPDGERAWMHGKWLDLGPEHAVVWIGPKEKARFIRHDGTALALGRFPAWVCCGTGSHKAIAAMFNMGQFQRVEFTAKYQRGAPGSDSAHC